MLNKEINNFYNLILEEKLTSTRSLVCSKEEYKKLKNDEDSHIIGIPAKIEDNGKKKFFKT
jgi:hypothetical protein